MTRRGCDRETELLMALREGALPDGLRTHLEHCFACQQTQRVATPLLAYAETMMRHAGPPSAASVWRRAQRQRQEAALRGASQAMLAMRTLGAMYGIGAMMWVLRMLWQTQPAARQAMLALRSGTVSLGVGAAVLLLIAGASCLMFFGQRQQPPLLR